MKKRTKIIILLSLLCAIFIPSALAIYREVKSKTLTVSILNASDPVTVNAYANKGTIPSTSEWSGTGSNSSKVAYYNSDYGALPTPTRAGYTFAGWYLNLVKAVDFLDNSEIYSGIVETGSSRYMTSDLITVRPGVTLYSNLEICGIYTYDANGNYITRVSRYTTTHPISSNAKYIRIEIKKEAGDYNWYLNNLVISEYQNAGSIEGISDQVTSSTKVKISEEHTIYAKWTQNTYTVTADANSGSIPSTSGWEGTGNTSTKSVTYDGTYGNLPTPTRAGYTFLGWNGKNLFNQSDVNTGEYLRSNGDVAQQSDWAYSNYIEIESGSTYTFNPNSSAGSGAFHCVYDANKNFIQSYESGLNTITMPLNAKYIRVSYRTSDSTNIQLEKGSTATAYETYYINSNTQVTIASNHTIKAIWERSKLTAIANGGSIPSTSGWTGTGDTSTKTIYYDSTYDTLPTPTRTGYTFDGWYLNLVKIGEFLDEYSISNGALDPRSSYMSTNNLIPVNPGVTLYSNIEICGIYTYDANGNYIGRISNRDTIHPISSNAAYIRIEIKKNDGDYNWYLNNLVISEYENAGSIEGINDPITSSTEVKTPKSHSMYAKWTANTYEVTYRGNGGTQLVNSNLVAKYDALYHNGNTLLDISGNGRNGLTTDVTFGKDYMEFNGSSSWVNLGIINSDYQTLEITFTPSALSGAIFNNFESGGSGFEFESHGKILAEFYIDGDDYYSVSSTTPLEIGKTYHLAATYDGTTIKLYINGVLESEYAVTGKIGSAIRNTVMVLGANPNESSPAFGYFSGKIYNAAIYDTALSAEQIASDATKTVTYDSTYGNLPTPAREGYTFAGWNGKNLLNYNDILPVAVSRDITVDSNGNISDGTPTTDDRGWTVANDQNWHVKLSAGTYVLSLKFSQVSTNQGYSSVGILNLDTGTLIRQTTGGELYNLTDFNYSFTLNSETNVGILVKAYSGIYKIQLEKGDTPTPWEPYLIDSSTKVTQAKNHILTAIWTPITYTVTADANGGTIPSTSGWNGTGNTATKTVLYTSTYGTLPTPTREGYTFKGWQLSDNALPSGYQAIEYMESSGTQYINTNYSIVSDDVKFEGAAYMSKKSSESDLIGVFGDQTLAVGTGWNNYALFAFSTGAGQAAISSSNDVDTYMFNTKFDFEVRYNSTTPNKEIIINGDSSKYASQSTTNGNFKNHTITIFNSNSRYYFTGRLYYLRIYDNGTLVRNMIPCVKNSTGKVGLYDLVYGGYYENASNSGNDFTTGSNISTFDTKVTNNTLVTKADNHTITAIWEAN